MDSIRQLVVRTVAAAAMETVKKAAFGLEHRVLDWALPALNTLAQRTKGPTPAEGVILGMETVLKLAEVRESHVPNVSLARSAVNFTDALHRIFQFRDWEVEW